MQRQLRPSSVTRRRKLGGLPTLATPRKGRSTSHGQRGERGHGDTAPQPAPAVKRCHRCLLVVVQNFEPALFAATATADLLVIVLI